MNECIDLTILSLKLNNDLSYSVLYIYILRGTYRLAVLIHFFDQISVLLNYQKDSIFIMTNNVNGFYSFSNSKK
jgi:hypothetical protein